MVFVLGAVSSALDALKSLTSSKSSSPQASGFSPDSTNPFDLSGSASPSVSSAPTSGASGFSQLAPTTLSALLAAQSQSSAGTTTPASTGPSAALKDLFSLLDANGDGQISKSEFENALGAGGTNIANADHVFNELDKSGDGSVNLGELSSALKGAGGKGHHHHFAGAEGSGASTASDGSSTDPLLQALQGASSTSTTTSLTYADGSKVTLTSPTAKTASSTATSSYNIIEQLIQREAQALSSSAATSLSVSV